MGGVARQAAGGRRRAGVNALAGRPLFGWEWLSVAIIPAWGVTACGLVAWHLARREAG